MRYSLRQNGNVTIIDLRGPISATRAIGSQPVLREVVRDLVKNGSRKLVLNLCDVTYVDSSGLGELVSCFATVRNQGGALKIANPPKQVQDLLRVTRLDTIINVMPDEATAVNSYRRFLKSTISTLPVFEP